LHGLASILVSVVGVQRNSGVGSGDIQVISGLVDNSDGSVLSSHVGGRRRVNEFHHEAVLRESGLLGELTNALLLGLVFSLTIAEVNNELKSKSSSLFVAISLSALETIIAVSVDDANLILITLGLLTWVRAGQVLSLPGPVARLLHTLPLLSVIISPALLLASDVVSAENKSEFGNEEITTLAETTVSVVDFSCVAGLVAGLVAQITITLEAPELSVGFLIIAHLNIRFPDLEIAELSVEVRI
jgi:hypothetical protein